MAEVSAFEIVVEDDDMGLVLLSAEDEMKGRRGDYVEGLTLRPLGDGRWMVKVKVKGRWLEHGVFNVGTQRG